jgi:H+-transporting ATPase
LTPQIAARAYELYGERAGNDGTAVQDWKKAEQEIRKDEAKTAPTLEDRVQPKPEVKADAPAPDARANKPKAEARDKTQPDVAPQLVKRVHELYEELGREEVQAVQDWEKANPELEEHEAHK